MKENDFYTAKELADELRVNIMTVYRYIKAEKLNTYKIGKEFRIDKEEFSNFLNKVSNKKRRKQSTRYSNKKKKKINHFYKNEITSLYNCDALDLLKTLGSNTISLVITSPPYNVAHDYDDYSDNLDEEDYLEFIRNIAKEIFRVCRVGGRVCINVPFAVKNRQTKRVSFLATKIADMFNGVGFLDFEMITWHKGRNIKHFQGNNTAWGSWRSPSSPNFRPLGEIILVFSKIKRRLDGDSKLSDLSADNFKEWTKNIWYIEEDRLYENVLPIPNTKTKRFDHPATFPVELVKRLIKLYSYTNDTILDPFNGTGTTTLSAFELERKSIGVDISRRYCSIAKERIINTNRKISLSFSKLVNQDDSKGSINEVFPYKESFSPNLFSALCKEFDITRKNNVLDPFIGTGSAFNDPGIKEAYGYDTNPLAIDVSFSKLINIDFDLDRDLDIIKNILSNHKKLVRPRKLPGWRQFKRYVYEEKYYYISNLINEIQKRFDINKSGFLKMIIISNLDKVFDYKRDGNGIKLRKSKIAIDGLDKYYANLFRKALLLKLKSQERLKYSSINIYNRSCLVLGEISDNSIDVILTSPPYVNMFDYFETYKIELWTGGYIKNIKGLKNLKKTAMRSNLNADITDQRLDIKEVGNFVDKIKNKRTRKMLHNYFFDMNQLIHNAYDKLKNNSWMFIVVGNSFYEAKPIPTDNLLAIIANHNKFNIQEVKKARSLRTSPQQMKVINKSDKKYLRESIICLKK